MSVDVPDQDDCNDDSCSSDSDSACLESDAFSEHQDNCLDLTETDGDELENYQKLSEGRMWLPVWAKGTSLQFNNLLQWSSWVPYKLPATE